MLFIDLRSILSFQYESDIVSQELFGFVRCFSALIPEANLINHTQPLVMSSVFYLTPSRLGVREVRQTNSDSSKYLKIGKI